MDHEAIFVHEVQALKRSRKFGATRRKKATPRGLLAPIKKRALAIREKVLGAEHPYVADSLNNLAWLAHQNDIVGVASLW